MEYVPFTSAVIAPHILRHLQAVATERGHDLEPALRRVGLDGEALSAIELRVSYRQGSLVIRDAMNAIGDPRLGLAVGSRQHAASWGVLGLAIMTAPTTWDGILLGLRYQREAGSLLDYLAEPAQGGMAVIAAIRDPAADACVESFLVDEAFASMVAVARDALAGDFSPDAVEVRHAAPVDVAGYLRPIGVQPRFGMPRNRFVLDERNLRRRPARADPWVYAQAVATLNSYAPSARERQELVQSLEEAVARALPDVPALSDQARRLLTSERTLRRRLAGSGTTYEAIVDGVRAATAQGLITDSDLPLDEVAHRVGYSDGRTLRRAVVRWTGSPPSALRATATVGPHPIPLPQPS